MRGRNPFRDAPVLTDHLRLIDLAREYEGMSIRVCCRAPKCIHCGDLEIARLLRGRNPPRILKELKQRARCTACSCRGEVVLFAAFPSRGH